MSKKFFDPKKNRTKSQFARDLDMNVIVKRYAQGHMPPAYGGGQYMDTTILPRDYQEAMDKVILANRSFEALPAQLRDRFGNSPHAMINFITDPKNKAEAQRLGIIAPDPELPPALPNEPKAASKPRAKGHSAPAEPNDEQAD